jgi:hypothetical protein
LENWNDAEQQEKQKKIMLGATLSMLSIYSAATAQSTRVK